MTGREALERDDAGNTVDPLDTASPVGPDAGRTMSEPAAGIARPHPIERQLEHEFRDPSLLGRALTHRSAAGEHNERLEFLGDAVIELVITEWLFRSLPGRAEGELTRLRAKVVRRESLAGFAREIALGEAMSLGGGELKSGGRHRDSILADGFEALVGALYLDAGLEVCARFLVGFVEPRLGVLARDGNTKDPKTRLQEWLQGRGMALPEYRVVRTEGMEHDRRFIIACSAGAGAGPVEGEGTSRRRAEQDAARRMLDALEAPGHG